MWTGMIGCFDCELKIVRQGCAVHVVELLALCAPLEACEASTQLFQQWLNE
jgi:hypothetical protein